MKTLSVFLVLASWSAWAGPITNVTQIHQNDKIVTVLTDSYHRTLYTFDPDQGSPKPTCNGRCAEVWPPLTVSDAEAADLKNPDLSVQKRDTGLNQVLYKGQPVYLYNLDRAVGDTKGDGVGNVWHLIAL